MTNDAYTHEAYLKAAECDRLRAENAALREVVENARTDLLKRSLHLRNIPLLRAMDTVLALTKDVTP